MSHYTGTNMTEQEWRDAYMVDAFGFPHNISQEIKNAQRDLDPVRIVGVIE